MNKKRTVTLLYKEESYLIQGGAFNIYKQFRNRHKEKVYHRALIEYLRNKGLRVETEKQIPIYFEGNKVGIYIPDIVINDCIFIELKCKPRLTRDDVKQFWHYLKGSEYRVGYLMNFGGINGVETMRRVYDTARSRKA